MKILLITMEYPPDKGGVGNYYKGLVNCLSDNQVEVLKITNKHFYKYFWPKWLKLYFIIKKLIKLNRPDIIWVGQVLPIGTVALMIKNKFKIPYFVSTHGLDILEPKKSTRKKKLMRKILDDASFITANSEYTKNLVTKLGLAAGKIEVIYPAAEIKPFVIEKTDKKVLLTVGRLVKRKNHSFVINCLPKLIKDFPNLEYVIIGNGPEKNNLVNQVKNLGLEKIIKFYDKVENNQLADFYAKSNVFVMPTLKSSDDAEGFGIVYLEAASFGLPVVASKLDGVTEAVNDGKTGFLIEPNNQTQFINIVTKLFKDPNLYQQVSNQSVEWAKKFNYSTSAKLIQQKLNEYEKAR